jgi:sulfite exporter TauE/SafE
MTFLAAFILGLAGSVHCALMCGPLTLALSGARRQNVRRWLWLHHVGRLTTYAIMGLVSGTLGAVVVWAGFERWLSIGAGAAVLILALQQWRGRPGFGARLGYQIKNRFAPLLKGQSAWSDFGLGAANGLLPCGLVYVACAAAAATGHSLHGSLVMLTFGLGTCPMLFGVHFASRAFGWAFPIRWRGMVLACAVFAGGLLIVRGMAFGIPYLSPSIQQGTVLSCCQK